MLCLHLQVQIAWAERVGEQWGHLLCGVCIAVCDLCAMSVLQVVIFQEGFESCCYDGSYLISLN